MQITKPVRESAARAGCEGTSGKRNRFFRGKHMSADEFRLEQGYLVGRRRLINRGVLGWGVVAGFELGGPSPSQAVTVSAGFALDRHGREIELGECLTLGAGNTYLLSADGCRTRALTNLTPGRYVLAVHYAERQQGDANLREGCGCDRPEKNFVCETAVFTLRPLDEKCGCPCVESGCERSCDCGAKACCPGGRGPHACLCRWVQDVSVADAGPELCEWEGLHVSLAGVDLACVTVAGGGDPCSPFEISSIDDTCSPRRLVKSNDLLFDLLRGCDLTRISAISWAPWHRAEKEIAWEDFAKMFAPSTKGIGDTEFVVRFSGPVQINTLRWDVFTITVHTIEQATGWRIGRRVPVVDPDTTPDAAGSPLPAGTTNQLRVRVKNSWIRDELERDRESWLSERGFSVEIEVRGDLILDCHGQALDANAIGLSPAPTGNGTPGGNFFSSFRVCGKPVENTEGE